MIVVSLPCTCCHGVHALVSDEGREFAVMLAGSGSTCECSPGRVWRAPNITPELVCPHLLLVCSLPRRQVTP